MQAVDVVVYLLLAGLLLWFIRKRRAQTAAAGKVGESVRGAGERRIDADLLKKHGLAAGEIRTWTRKEVAQHNTPEDLWIIVDGKVFDVSGFVEDHPGGQAIANYAGKDNTKAFHGPQHPERAYSVLEDYFLGDFEEE
eukprot:gb/GEZN01027214.1/.p2 GENE.gb/GEZN01027214.1/~~gb/GEZN01027214.1/.p2  ORF type:complete len:138 (+),score=26.37 gb/GEZN01027214.1/:78-491(+)